MENFFSETGGTGAVGLVKNPATSSNQHPCRTRVILVLQSDRSTHVVRSSSAGSAGHEETCTDGTPKLVTLKKLVSQER